MRAANCQILLAGLCSFCLLGAAPAQGPKPDKPPQGVEKKQGVEPGKQGKEPGKQGKESGKQGQNGKGKEKVEEQPVQQPPAEEPVIPAGTDPADIAAIRSAQAMLEAEKKLARMIKEGKLEGLDKILTFDELESWPYEDGLKGMPGRVKQLDGKKVLMTGFMLPIDEVEKIKEFLLVQSLWSCCYGQPPDINGIVRVVMPKGKTTDYYFDPLKIIGTFKVEATVLDGYCVDIYQLHVDSIEPIR